MARPLKTGMQYFPHDTDAVNDEKLEAMRSLFGNDGYAFYFILLERIYRTQGGELDIGSIIKKATVVGKLLIDNEKFNRMLEAAFEVDLFDMQHYNATGMLTSNGIKKRFAEVDKIREKWRKKKEVFSRENKGENSVENGQKTPEIKEKESKNKVKEIGVIGTRPKFKPPTLEEVKAYCQERHNSVNPEKWLSYYTSNGWKVGKNPMKDWKAAIRTWEQDNPKESKSSNIFADIAKERGLV